MKNNVELRGALNMILARLETEPKTPEEWNTIQIALSDALGYSVKVKRMFAQLAEGAVARALSAQGEESARALRSQGWQGGGATYDLGAYHGDLEAAEERVGRTLTSHERLMLEASVRTNLDAFA